MIEYIHGDGNSARKWIRLFPEEDYESIALRIILSFTGDEKRRKSLTELDWSALDDQ